MVEPIYSLPAEEKSMGFLRSTSVDFPWPKNSWPGSTPGLPVPSPIPMRCREKNVGVVVAGDFSVVNI